MSRWLNKLTTNPSLFLCLLVKKQMVHKVAIDGWLFEKLIEQTFYNNVKKNLFKSSYRKPSFVLSLCLAGCTLTGEEVLVAEYLLSLGPPHSAAMWTCIHTNTHTHTFSPTTVTTQSNLHPYPTCQSEALCNSML